MIEYVEYELYYKPESTVMKYKNFDAKSDLEAKKIAKDTCKEYNARLIKLRKVTAEIIMAGI